MKQERWGAFLRGTVAVAIAVTLGGCGMSGFDKLTTNSIASAAGAVRQAPANPAPPVQLAHAPAISSHLSAFSATRPPAGFRGFCERDGWACGVGARARGLSEAAILKLARGVNSQVNRSVRPASDMETVGRDEHWSLPINGSGDCEDYALLKKKLLMEAGVPSSRLALATAINRQGEAHAVLILRLSSGDLVLDNLAASITGWRSTGYTFLKMQRFEDQWNWDLVLEGPRARRT